MQHSLQRGKTSSQCFRTRGKTLFLKILKVWRAWVGSHPRALRQTQPTKDMAALLRVFSQEWTENVSVTCVFHLRRDTNAIQRRCQISRLQVLPESGALSV